MIIIIIIFINNFNNNSNNLCTAVRCNLSNDKKALVINSYNCQLGSGSVFARTTSHIFSRN